MLRTVVEVAPIAVLLAVAVPQPSAEAMGMASLQSGNALTLVGSERRGRDNGARENGRVRPEAFRHHSGNSREVWSVREPSPDDADCGWLRRRAIETDSTYWWRRYRKCRGR
jgi:hypothetical protein